MTGFKTITEHGILQHAWFNILAEWRAAITRGDSYNADRLENQLDEISERLRVMEEMIAG